MNKTIILYPADFTERANHFLSTWFVEHYAHSLEIYTDSRNRQKIKWCFTGVCRLSMFIKPHGFSISNINFDTKTIDIETHNKTQEFIKNLIEKINS
jgi:hypothetical protein